MEVYCIICIVDFINTLVSLPLFRLSSVFYAFYMPIRIVDIKTDTTAIISDSEIRRIFR